MNAHLVAHFFQTIRRADWPIPPAVFHLIDNALAAGARHVWVYIRPAATPMDAVVEVVDDGAGMDAAGIRLALSLGSGATDVGALGAFGLGLKAAAVSLGETLSVASSTGLGAPFSRSLVRFRDVEASGRYTAAAGPLDPDDAALLDRHLPGGRGTLVRVDGLALGTRSSIRAVLAVLQSEAALTYASFLDGGVSLQIGGVTVAAADPLRASEADSAEDDGRASGYRWLLRSRRLVLDPETRVSGEFDVTQRSPTFAPAYARRLDRPEHDGLYIYRNRRLVAAALRPWGLPRDEDGGAAGFRGRLSVTGEADGILGLDLQKAVDAIPDDAESSLCRVLLPKLQRAWEADA